MRKACSVRRSFRNKTRTVATDILNYVLVLDRKNHCRVQLVLVEMRKICLLLLQNLSQIKYIIASLHSFHVSTQQRAINEFHALEKIPHWAVFVVMFFSHQILLLMYLYIKKNQWTSSLRFLKLLHLYGWCHFDYKRIHTQNECAVSFNNQVFLKHWLSCTWTHYVNVHYRLLGKNGLEEGLKYCSIAF